MQEMQKHSKSSSQEALKAAPNTAPPRRLLDLDARRTATRRKCALLGLSYTQRALRFVQAAGGNRCESRGRGGLGRKHAGIRVKGRGSVSGRWRTRLRVVVAM